MNTNAIAAAKSGYTLPDRSTSPEPMQHTDEHALLLTALEKSEGLCPSRSECVACEHVEYVYFVGVLCRSQARKIGAGGLCESRRPAPAAGNRAA